MSPVITRCHPLYPAVTRCHPLSLVVIRYHLLSPVTTSCHPLSPVVTCCHPSSPVVIRRHPLCPSSSPSPYLFPLPSPPPFLEKTLITGNFFNQFGGFIHSKIHIFAEYYPISFIYRLKPFQDVYQPISRRWFQSDQNCGFL